MFRVRSCLFTHPRQLDILLPSSVNRIFSRRQAPSQPSIPCSATPIPDRKCPAGNSAASALQIRETHVHLNAEQRFCIVSGSWRIFFRRASAILFPPASAAFAIRRRQTGVAIRSAPQQACDRALLIYQIPVIVGPVTYNSLFCDRSHLRGQRDNQKSKE